MKSLMLIICAFLLFPLNHFICDWVFPENDKLSCEAWDRLKHFIYVVWGGMIAGTLLFDRTEQIDKWVKLFAYAVAIGMVIPASIDKYGHDRHLHWYDIAFALLALYAGLKRFFPIWHEKIGVSFINLVSCGLADGNYIYNYICRQKK